MSLSGTICVIRLAVNVLLVEASTRYSVAVAEVAPHDRFTSVEETGVADKLVNAAGATGARGALSASRKPISFASNKSVCVSVIWKSPNLSPQGFALAV